MEKSKENMYFDTRGLKGFQYLSGFVINKKFCIGLGVDKLPT